MFERKITLKKLYELAAFKFSAHARGAQIPSRPAFCSPDAVEHFEKRISDCDFFYEWGGGGSTIVADLFGKYGITVESDRTYASALHNTLQNQQRRTISYINVGITEKWGKPIFKFNLSGKAFLYSNAILDNCDFTEKNLFLIDGRFRKLCLLHLLYSYTTCSKEKMHQTILFDDYFQSSRQDAYSVDSIIQPAARIGRLAEFNLTENAAVQPPTETDLLSIAHDYR